jgi:hypothetical protein
MAPSNPEPKMTENTITSGAVADVLQNVDKPAENVVETIYDALRKVKPASSKGMKLINEHGQKLSRRFLGSISGNGILKKEFEAYVKGRAIYSYKNQMYAVRQEYFYITV